MDIVSAVESNDWMRFKFLSDRPFPNEESMFEQFENSRKKVAPGFGDWEKLAGADVLDDGTRLIMVRIQPRPGSDQEVLLTLHNISDRISVWVFAEQIDWSKE
ncbi:hypothetical protein ASD44_12785 [Mesorhizobium sp. Root554]|nr:hypothetical protein ASD27_12790 [Mesorhizobium sp. Root1471]KQZ37350.1 hypothetical protein ASD44_12785 [Mesorhizobium sp. Root554]